MEQSPLQVDYGGKTFLKPLMQSKKKARCKQVKQWLDFRSWLAFNLC